MEFENDQVAAFAVVIVYGTAMQSSAVHKMDRGMTAQAREDLELSLDYFMAVTTTPRETTLGAAGALRHAAHVYYAGSLALLGRVALLEGNYELARAHLRTAELGLQREGAKLQLPLLMWQLKAEAWGLKGIKRRRKLLRRIFGLVDPERQSWLLRAAIVVDSLSHKI